MNDKRRIIKMKKFNQRFRAMYIESMLNQLNIFKKQLNETYKDEKILWSQKAKEQLAKFAVWQGGLFCSGQRHERT